MNNDELKAALEQALSTADVKSKHRAAAIQAYMKANHLTEPPTEEIPNVPYAVNAVVYFMLDPKGDLVPEIEIMQHEAVSIRTMQRRLLPNRGRRPQRG